MAPPMPHQLIPLLDVEYDDPLLVSDDEVHYVVGLSSLRRTYVERILSSKTCTHKLMKMLYGNLSSIYLLHVLFVQHL